MHGIIFALALAAGFGGCQLFAPSPITPKSPATRPRATGPVVVTAEQPRPLTDAAGKPLPMPLFPRVRVLKLTLPAGTFSTNEKIWNQLNEDAIDGKTATLLAQNGMRAAVGPQAKWPDIKTLIDTPGATTDEYICQTDSRSAITIMTRAQMDSQTVFFVDSDLHMQGDTFAECTNLLRLSMSQQKSGGPVTIQVEPVVRLPPGPPPSRFVLPGTPPPVPTNEITFSNLRIATAVDGQNFLVLAPSDPTKNAFSVGGRFLTAPEKVPATEVILIFVPLPNEKPKK